MEGWRGECGSCRPSCPAGPSENLAPDAVPLDPIALHHLFVHYKYRTAEKGTKKLLEFVHEYSLSNERLAQHFVWKNKFSNTFLQLKSGSNTHLLMPHRPTWTISAREQKMPILKKKITRGFFKNCFPEDPSWSACSPKDWQINNNRCQTNIKNILTIQFLHKIAWRVHDFFLFGRGGHN